MNEPNGDSYIYSEKQEKESTVDTNSCQPLQEQTSGEKGNKEDFKQPGEVIEKKTENFQSNRILHAPKNLILKIGITLLITSVVVLVFALVF